MVLFLSNTRVNHASWSLQNLGPLKNTPEANETDDAISRQTADILIDLACKGSGGLVAMVVCASRFANSDITSTPSKGSSIQIMAMNGHKIRRSSAG